jgi:hypothetical protein
MRGQFNFPSESGIAQLLHNFGWLLLVSGASQLYLIAAMSEVPLA